MEVTCISSYLVATIGREADGILQLAKMLLVTLELFASASKHGTVDACMCEIGKPDERPSQ